MDRFGRYLGKDSGRLVRSASKRSSFSIPARVETEIADGSTDENDFVISSKQYIDIAHRADITAVVHSHPDASNEPSEADIKYCNATGLPYYIFSYPSMDMHILQPQKETKNLYGREYEFIWSTSFYL